MRGRRRRRRSRRKGRRRTGARIQWEDRSSVSNRSIDRSSANLDRFFRRGGASLDQIFRREDANGFATDSRDLARFTFVVALFFVIFQRSCATRYSMRARSTTSRMRVRWTLIKVTIILIKSLKMAQHIIDDSDYFATEKRCDDKSDMISELSRTSWLFK